MNRILASNELIYNITEDQRIIEQHKNELKNQELQIKNSQKSIIMFFAMGLFCLLLFSFYTIIKLKKSKKEINEKNKEITLKNKQVKSALSEKEVLLKEIHHRVKNNLQVISGLLELQNISISDSSIKLALKESQNRIQSVALVHKMMYQSENISKVNMQQYLEELIQLLQVSYGSKNKAINTTINAHNIDLDVTVAVPISLIVNEAVCNIYKHAFNNKKNGQIYLSVLKISNKEYSLLIKDNGIGLPENFNISKLKSIGFDLIKGLSKQVKGTLKVQNNKGTEIKILFNGSKI